MEYSLIMTSGFDILIQFYNAPRNDFQAKLVFKPLSPDRLWKFVYEPIHQDVRILSKKIPVTKFLNLQVWGFFDFTSVLSCVAEYSQSSISLLTSVGIEW